ncbi:hypothetical protein OIU78_001469 [Salix suchowensis]|nr:hypothetical protein OIU78_001469 [Salix suchowensis]
MFGREIENIVACEGLERIERHERYAIEVVGGRAVGPSMAAFSCKCSRLPMEEDRESVPAAEGKQQPDHNRREELDQVEDSLTSDDDEHCLQIVIL